VNLILRFFAKLILGLAVVFYTFRVVERLTFWLYQLCQRIVT